MGRSVPSCLPASVPLCLRASVPCRYLRHLRKAVRLWPWLFGPISRRHLWRAAVRVPCGPWRNPRGAQALFWTKLSGIRGVWISCGELPLCALCPLPVWTYRAPRPAPIVKTGRPALGPRQRLACPCDKPPGPRPNVAQRPRRRPSRRFRAHRVPFGRGGCGVPAAGSGREARPGGRLAARRFPGPLDALRRAGPAPGDGCPSLRRARAKIPASFSLTRRRVGGRFDRCGRTRVGRLRRSRRRSAAGASVGDATTPVGSGRPPPGACWRHEG